MWNVSVKSLSVLLCAFLFFTACKSRDKKAPQALEENSNLFYDYKIIAEEGNDNLLVMAQLKEGGEEGDVIPLPADAALLLDGETMQKDSAKIGGEYYEVYRAIDSFAGPHSISYKENGKELNKTSFDYSPFSLLTQLGSTVSRKAFTLSFKGLDTTSDLRIVLTDTSYTSEGVNELWEVKDSTLNITSAMLANIKNGPVQLSLTREKELPLEGGGRILNLYTIRREFLLID